MIPGAQPETAKLRMRAIGSSPCRAAKSSLQTSSAVAPSVIGEEVPEPLGPEYARFYEEQRLGMDVRTALMGLQARIDSLDLRMFVTAVLMALP